MRERLVLAFAGLTVFTIASFAVVFAFSALHTLREVEQAHLSHSAAEMAEEIAARVRNDQVVTGSFLQRRLAEGESARYAPLGGKPVRATTAGYASGGGDGDMVSRSHPVAGGGELTLSRSLGSIKEQVAHDVVPVMFFGMLLVIVAALLGFLAARHLSRPFQDLATLAGEFAKGRFEVKVPHYDVLEAEAIGLAMTDAQREVTGLIKREREFAASGSHQLKTPITALKLGLEDLALWPQTHPDVAAELSRGISELDRLGTSVNGLLEEARGRRVRSALEIDLCALIREAAERWQPRVRAAKRTLVALTPAPIPVRLAPAPVAQILDVLIDNALAHGQGVISVTVVALDSYVRVQVSDQGRSQIDDEVFKRKLDVRLLAAGDGEDTAGNRRSGISLSVATEIAGAMGGYLRLEPAETSTFVLMIPRSRPLS